jgi:hypothetical protein
LLKGLAWVSRLDRAPTGSDRAPIGNDKAPTGNDRAPIGSDRAPTGKVGHGAWRYECSWRCGLVTVREEYRTGTSLYSGSHSYA